MIDTIKISPDQRVCEIHVSGALDLDTYAQTREQFMALPGWHRDIDYLMVYRRVYLAEFTPEVADQLMSRFEAFDRDVLDGRRVRMAFVCADETAEPLMRFWEALSAQRRPVDERFFRSETDARAWLQTPRA